MGTDTRYKITFQPENYENEDEGGEDFPHEELARRLFREFNNLEIICAALKDMGCDNLAEKVAETSSEIENIAEIILRNSERE